MSAKERLTRLRALQAMATQLQVALIEECDLTRKQVDAIEASIQEGEDRCQAMDTGSWDGKQPDAWKPTGGKTWRRPNSSDIGKMVRVTNQLGVNPEKLPEAELFEITRCGEPIIRGTKGYGVCWSYAWIEAGRTDVVDTDGKGFISIQIDGVDLKSGLVGAWKPAPANKSEQADPLIDGEDHETNCVIMPPEDKWRPMVGDWVRIKKCDPTCCWVGIGMDYLDGQIRQVEELTTDGSGIVVDSFWLCGICIEPWEPREGEKVQVINDNQVYEVESFDKTSLLVFVVGRYLGIELRLLKPYIEPEPQYRDPTNEDFGKKVEVRDEELAEWMEAVFVAVLPPGDCRFVVEDDYGSRACWRFARIKVEG